MQKLRHENFIKARDYIFAQGDDEGLQKLQIKYETYCTLYMLEKLDRFDMIER